MPQACRMTLKTNSHHHQAAEYYRQLFLNFTSTADCQKLVLETWQDLPKDCSAREDQK
jgi:hypothetical protein